MFSAARRVRPFSSVFFPKRNAAAFMEASATVGEEMGAEAEMRFTTAGHYTKIPPREGVKQSYHQEGEDSTDDIYLPHPLEKLRPQSASASHSPRASSLKDDRGRRLSRGTFLAVDNEFSTEQVGHLGRPTPSVQVSAPGEDPRTPTDDNERSRAPSRHSDFKSITTIDDFGFSIGLNQISRSGPRKRASSDSLHPHYLVDGTRTPAFRPDDRDTQGTLNGLGAVFVSSPPEQSATAEELGQDLDDTEYLDHVDNQLRDAFEDSHHDAKMDQDFLPLDKLVSLLDKTRINQILHRAFPGEVEKIETMTLAIHSNVHQNSRRMILAVLILIGKVVCIEDFIQNDIRDIHLPLRLHKNKQQRNVVQVQKRSAPEVIYLDKWKWNDMENFTNTQYRVLAPFFDMPPDDLHFYKIDNGRIILPFLEWEKKISGGYGTVWKVKIHPAHHSFVDSDGSRSTNPYFAIKEIHSDEYEAYKQEVKVLERFSGPNPGHDHLIRLRVAFQHAKNYYLLFDWAHGNLVDLWEQTPDPTSSPVLVRWLIKQCLGIADGLRKIHHHGSWSSNKNLSITAHAEDADKNRGRHGDIKPENILCFMPPGHKQHHLVVSDFGLTRFHSAKSVSHVPQDKVLGLSRTYRAPEFDTQRYISQAYDMWSLGCLYLEFISWFLVGYEATRGYKATRETFQSIRLEEDEPLGDSIFPEDKFFNIKSRSLGPPNTYVPQVKDCVVKWIHDLQGQENCSQCIRDFLHHIKHSLLVPDPAQREKIDQFHTHLTHVYKLCEASVGYCDPLQTSSPDRRESSVPIDGQPTEMPSSSDEATSDAEDLTLILSELKKLETNGVGKGSGESDASPTIDEPIEAFQHAETDDGETSAPPDGNGLNKTPIQIEDNSRAACYTEATAVLKHGETDLTALSLNSGPSGKSPVDTPFTTQGSDLESLADGVDTGDRQSSDLERTTPCGQRAHSPEHVERHPQDHPDTAAHHVEEPDRMSHQISKQGSELETKPAKHAEPILSHPPNATTGFVGVTEHLESPVRKIPRKMWEWLRRTCYRIKQFFHKRMR
ncbi:serine/threonine protein kinase [Seiridium cupressi]